MDSIRVRGLNLALERPVETASGVVCITPLVLIDLATKEDSYGETGNYKTACALVARHPRGCRTGSTVLNDEE